MNRTGLQCTAELKPGKPLKRRTELARNTPLSNRPAKTHGGSATRRPRRAISEASESQRAKVRGQLCIACGRGQSEHAAIDPAHLWPRGLGGCDHPDCVVPLCRTFNGGCHRAYDEGRLDIAEKLEPRYRAEIAHALEHASLELVYQRVNGLGKVAA